MKTKGFVDDLRKAAGAVFLATDEDVAVDLSEKLLKAAKRIEQAESALKVLYTWAGTPGALHPDHVRDLCAKALWIDE